MNREEEKIQSQCYQWFHNTFPQERKMLFHVDNNSWNNVIGAKKKALGVNAGVSDMVYILPFGNVAFLECKTIVGEQSDEQKIFQRKVMERGHIYLIFRNLAEFKEIITNLQQNEH